MRLISEFKDFLREYKVMGLAVAFIMGGAINTLVNSLVNDLIMPAVTPFIPEGGWQTATVALGPVVLNVGSFAGQALNFVILALVVFMFAKFVMHEELVKKK